MEYRIIKAESCAINIDITAELLQPQSAAITVQAGPTYIETIEVKDKLRVQCTSWRHFSTFNHKITVQSLHVFITYSTCSGVVNTDMVTEMHVLQLRKSGIKREIRIH